MFQDSNQYNHCVKNKINIWIEQLSKVNADWLLIVLDKKDTLTRITKAKLPLKKSNIIDKIKSDFGSKGNNKLVSWKCYLKKFIKLCFNLYL